MVAVIRALVSVIVLTIAGSGCTKQGRGPMIRVKGSDTMVNLVQAWAETYKSVVPSVTVEVAGGGSGVGIAALISGSVDFASCSREMHSDEIERAEKRTGKKVHSAIVGYDGLAVYVHKDNPLEQLCIPELAEVFAENGSITRWSQLGVKVPGCDADRIVLVGRQSSSGTFVYFREHVLRNRDFRMGIRSMNGSKEVVELVGSTPCAIGYSGMGYATSEVKMLRLCSEKGGEAYSPTAENVTTGKYPLARPLYLYWVGDLQGPAKAFLEWVLSPEGQAIVARAGYVPLSQVSKGEPQ